MLEKFLINADGLTITDSTWTYKIPTIDTIPMQLNVEMLNSGHHKQRVLSSKGMFSGLCWCSFIINSAFFRLKVCFPNMS